jgi:glutamine synthetase
MCTIVDSAGVTRCKGIPIERIEGAAQRGVGLSDLFAVFAVNDLTTSSPGFDTPSGDMRVLPDLEQLNWLSAPAGWAWAPGDQHDQDLAPTATCQRGTLKRMTADANDLGISFQMAYEVEFMLFNADDTPVHDGPSFSPRAFFEADQFCIDLLDALAQQGIVVEQLHPEYAIGQYELAVAPGSPLEAADQHVLLRLTVIRVARIHGFKVSFAPVAQPGIVGNGRHLHISAWRDGRNLMHGGDAVAGLTAEGEALAAGILHRLPELMAVVAPSVVSYDRLQPHRFAGPFTCWGPENREAALRLIRGTIGTSDRAANFELKAVDGASNPYLVPAVVIGAALDGVRAQRKLPPPVVVDPTEINDEEQRRLGLRRLPLDLGEAISGFEKSHLAREILGIRLFEAFLAVRRLEWETYRDTDPDEAIFSHRWRYG